MLKAKVKVCHFPLAGGVNRVFETILVGSLTYRASTRALKSTRNVHCTRVTHERALLEAYCTAYSAIGVPHTCS